MGIISEVRREPAVPPPAIFQFHLAPDGDAEGKGSRPEGHSKAAEPREELPYLVELWDDDKRIVEQVLAVTAHTSIGYAAYYAATREYPDRYVTLRHKNRTIARSIEPKQ